MLGAERDIAAQVVLGMFIAAFFGGIDCAIQPYADPRTNAFRILADSSLVVTLLIMLVLYFKDHLQDEGCEQLTEGNLETALILVNFVLLLVAASQEGVRRLYQKYRTQLLGIMYDPSTRLKDGTGANAAVYSGTFQQTSSSDVVMCAVKARAVEPHVEAVESALMLNCAHRNIVSMYRAERCGNMSYLAMELCESSLQFAIRSKDTRFKSLDTSAVCKAVAEAVMYMHEEGFVHGNITPRNILLINDRPKISGFSNARKVNRMTQEGEGSTQMWAMLGTPGYQPPELFGRKPRLTTEVQNPVAVDVFGLGCRCSLHCPAVANHFVLNVIMQTLE